MTKLIVIAMVGVACTWGWAQTPPPPAPASPTPEQVRLFNQALALQQKGKNKEAIAIYQQIVLLNPRVAEAFFNMATLQQRTGQMDESVANFRHAAQLTPNDPNPWIQIAAIETDRRNLGIADAALQKAKPNATKNAFYFMALGNFGMAKKDYKLARDSLERALKILPKNDYARINLGAAYIELKQPQKALSIAKSITATNPKMPAAWRLMAVAANATGDKAASAKAYKKLESMGQADAPVLLQLAVSLEAKKDTVGAEKLYRRVVTTYPMNHEARVRYGILLYRANRWPEAEVQFRAALSADPNDRDSMINLANVVVQQGQVARNAKQKTDRFEEAERLYQRVKKTEPKRKATYQGLAFLYDLMHRDTGALANYRSWIEEFPKDSEPHVGIGRIYQQQQKAQPAEEEYRAALVIKPDDDMTRSALAMVLETSNQLDKALEQFEKLAARKPKDIAPRMSIGSIYEKQNKYDKALETYEAAKKAFPKDSGPYLAIAGIYDTQKQKDKAVAEYKAMVAAQPGDGASAVRAVQYIEQNGKWEDGVDILRKAMDVSTEPVSILPQLAALYQRHEQADKGAAEYEKWIAKLPKDPRVRYYYASLLTIMTKHNEAAEQYRQLAKLEPTNLAWQIDLGTSLVSAGKPAEALIPLDKALEKTPDNPSIWAALEQAYTVLKQPEKLYERLRIVASKGTTVGYAVERMVAVAPLFGKSAEALNIVEAALVKHPKSAALLRAHARALAGAKMDERALEAFGKACAASPTDMELAQEAATFADAKGTMLQRIAFYKRLSDLTLTTDPAPSLKLVGYYRQKGDLASALRLAQSVAEKHPTNEEAKKLVKEMGG